MSHCRSSVFGDDELGSPLSLAGGNTPGRLDETRLSSQDCFGGEHDPWVVSTSLAERVNQTVGFKMALRTNRVERIL